MIWVPSLFVGGEGMDGEEWRMHCELRRICKNEWERGGDWDREGRSKVEEE